MQNKKSQLHWTWILIILFFGFAIYSPVFGILAIICMMMPLYFSLTGKGKINCSHYCPRGSFLGKFIPKLSLENTLPDFFRTKFFKNLFFIFMITVMLFSIISAKGDITKIGFAFLRMVGITTILGIVMGIFCKPRSWCQICPMGYASGELHILKNKNKQK